MTLLVIAATCSDIVAAGSSGSSPLELKSANSNINENINGEFVTTLKGNVVFEYSDDDLMIRSDFAKMWRTQANVQFNDNVRVNRKKARQVLRCSALRYQNSEKSLIASGGLDYRDSLEQIRITSQTGSYFPKSRSLNLEGKPKFFQYDTSVAETLTISGEHMSYIDSIKTVFVDNRVVIIKGKFIATCTKARYLTDSSKALLRVKPIVNYLDNRIIGDSIDCYFLNKRLHGVSVRGNAKVYYREKSETDTSIATIFGDSLYMAFSDSGALDTVWAHRNVKSTYCLVKDSLHVNEAYGKRMRITFAKGKNIEHIAIWGNARTLYYVDDPKTKGRNLASGDSIHVTFVKSAVSNLNLSGNVRGTFLQDITSTADSAVDTTKH